MRTWAAVITAVWAAGLAAEAAPLVFETDLARWEIAPDAKTAAFASRQSGRDIRARVDTGPCARVRIGAEWHAATGAAADERGMRLAFGETGVEAVLGVTRHAPYLVLEVLEIAQGDKVDELVFVDIPLALEGSLDEPFAACALALNLQTNVTEIPGPSKRLRAMCYGRFGLVGAKAALVAAPTAQLRDVLKEVVAAAEGLPHHKDQSVPPIGGPWALDAPINRGSYLFDFGSITEDTVDDWIELAGKFGLNQIDFHIGKSLRFGDLRPNPELFPNGRASVKAVLDRLEEAGFAAGLHTYAFFLAKDSRYVTPVPDPRLGKDATFTLAAPLSRDGTEIEVKESTADISTDTGFFIRNSVTLHIGDELITFSGVTKEPPYRFTGCTRGACGTTPAAHETGARADKLKECFGLFAPDPESTLLAEVARNTAETFNECGFDMIYLDALDGSDVLAGRENAWHYGSKYVFEIANRLEKPALFEMSTFHHHLWYVRARMGAWDHPARSHKRFIDKHCAANAAGRGMYLPMNLGWWAVKTWQDGDAAVYTEPTYADDIEYLMGKCLGHNWGFALMGVNPGNICDVPLYRQLMPIFERYEALRHGGAVPEPVLAKLREPGAEFTLVDQEGGAPQLRPVRYTEHKVECPEPWSNTWTVENTFEEQPLRLRIEALMSAASYEDPDAVVVEAFDGDTPLPHHRAADGITASIAACPETGGAEKCAARITASNSGNNRAGSWAEFAQHFESPLNIAGKPAFGVWVRGDGSGALLNVQVRSSEGKAAGGLGDHYITLDFTGWRYFELVEFEGARIEEQVWPYGGAYAVYRERVDFGAVERFAVWCNNVPAGGAVECQVSAIKALPLKTATLRNPKLTVNGASVAFPVEMASGSYLEFDGAGECVVYGKKGEELARAKPDGEVPVLKPGGNEIAFECGAADSVTPRARVTVSTIGAVSGGI